VVVHAKPTLPLRGGDASAQASLFEDAFFKKNLLSAKEKLHAVENHPLLGGAKLKALTSKRPGVGF